jgi:hypothetical protein
MVRCSSIVSMSIEPSKEDSDEVERARAGVVLLLE